jgi:hypothetical protein
MVRKRQRRPAGSDRLAGQFTPGPSYRQQFFDEAADLSIPANEVNFQYPVAQTHRYHTAGGTLC